MFLYSPLLNNTYMYLPMYMKDFNFLDLAQTMCNGTNVNDEGYFIMPMVHLLLVIQFLNNISAF